jgi:hypothetical protein
MSAVYLDKGIHIPPLKFSNRSSWASQQYSISAVKASLISNQVLPLPPMFGVEDGTLMIVRNNHRLQSNPSHRH